MATINFKCSARVENVHVRHEGSKSEGTQVPAIDLKLSANMPGGVLAAILGATPASVRHFWLDGDNRIPAFPHLAEMKSTAVFENCNVTIGKAAFRSAKVRNFVFTIDEQDHIALTFSIAFADLSDKSSGLLCRLFHEQIALVVESAQLDAFEDDESGADNAE